jgi:hypothetical protein
VTRWRPELRGRFRLRWHRFQSAPLSPELTKIGGQHMGRLQLRYSSAYSATAGRNWGASHQGCSCPATPPVVVVVRNQHVDQVARRTCWGGRGDGNDRCWGTIMVTVGTSGSGGAGPSRSSPRASPSSCRATTGSEHDLGWVGWSCKIANVPLWNCVIGF